MGHCMLLEIERGAQNVHCARLCSALTLTVTLTMTLSVGQNRAVLFPDEPSIITAPATVLGARLEVGSGLDYRLYAG